MVFTPECSVSYYTAQKKVRVETWYEGRIKKKPLSETTEKAKFWLFTDTKNDSQMIVLVSKGQMSTAGRFRASNGRQSMENLSALSHISSTH